MKLKAGTKSIKFFMNALQVLNTETHFSFSPAGGFAVSKCPSGTRLCDAWISAEDLIEYEAEHETAGVDVQRVNDILKTVSSEDKVELTGGSPHPLMLNAGDVRYQIDNIEILNIVGKIPDQDRIEAMRSRLLTKVKLKSGDLKKAITRSAKLKSIDLVLETNNGKLDVLTEGDIDKLTSSIELLEHSGKDARSRYSTEYMQEVMKAATSNTDTTLWFGTNNHLCMRFENGNSYVEFFVAYRMKTEGEG